MMQNGESLQFSRRTLFGFAAAALGGMLIPASAEAAFAAGAVPDQVRSADGIDASQPSESPRFLFTCDSPLGDIGPFTSLSGVWSSPGYMSINSGTALYIGQGSFVLTPDESAIVSIAEDAGMKVTDRGALYLTILGACTRIRTAVLPQTLTALGAPVVEAAVAREPDAPQAGLFRNWLDAQAQ